MKSQFTEQELQIIANIQEERNSTRKAATAYFKRHRAEYMAKGTKPAAAVAPAVEKPEVKLPAKNASLVAKGAAYHVLAGRPSKDAVVGVFGKSGYALSWVSRAERLGVTPQELCEAFRTNPNKLADKWAALEAK